MTSGKAIICAALVALLSVAGCSNRAGEVARLHNLKSPHGGPDEFAILPTKPLQMPEDLAALPEPTPKGTNLTDQRPLDDAIIALGGRPDAGGGDPALLAAATRYGITSDVRETLSQEDEAIRRRRGARPLERLFRTPVYARTYSAQTMRPRDETDLWRRAGARTPALPEY